MPINYPLTCNSTSDTSISPRYTNSMMNWRSKKPISAGNMIVGCSHGFSSRTFWKYSEHADRTTWKDEEELIKLISNSL